MSHLFNVISVQLHTYMTLYMTHTLLLVLLSLHAMLCCGPLVLEGVTILDKLHVCKLFMSPAATHASSVKMPQRMQIALGKLEDLIVKRLPAADLAVQTSDSCWQAFPYPPNPLPVNKPPSYSIVLTTPRYPDPASVFSSSPDSLPHSSCRLPPPPPPLFFPVLDPISLMLHRLTMT